MNLFRGKNICSRSDDQLRDAYFRVALEVSIGNVALVAIILTTILMHNILNQVIVTHLKTGYPSISKLMDYMDLATSNGTRDSRGPSYQATCLI